jgi:uncharacterized membrane protein YvbJ
MSLVKILKGKKQTEKKMADQQLIDAVKSNDLNKVRTLLNNGADPNARVCYQLSNLL